MISSNDDVSLFIESHWETFSNTSRFQVSTTNLLPEVRSNIQACLHNMNESFKAENSREPWMTNDFCLVWAATDGTNYVVYWSPRPLTPEDEFVTVGYPDYDITAAMREAGGANLIISTGPCSGSCYCFFNPLKNYQAFVDYEWAEAADKLGGIQY